MTCPRCQQDNPPHARFCLGCGARLALTCGSCGAELPGAARFCLQCGQAVTAGTAAGAGSPAPETYTPKHLAEKILTSKAALEGERKQVTVLFADLKSSMELLADRDPEEARKLLDPVLERMMEAVHRYEGTVNQVMGDGIMALFGAPLAHEDHAVRACYAALRMQEAVKQYAEDVRRSEGVLVQIRVGLNSGEVVVRSIGSDLHMDYTAVGQTTHLAARMEQLAAPGSVLITADTLRLAEGYVQVKPLGPVHVKGLSDPVDVYEVTGAGVVRSRLQAAASRGLSRFVGRDAEVAQLRRAGEKASGGQGQIVAVVGEPGVGKSRLFYEFTHSHRTHDWLILESSSVSFGKATPFLPVSDLLRSYFRILDGDDPQTIREKVIGKLVALDEALKPLLSAVLGLLDTPVDDAAWQALEPAQRRQRTLDAIKRLLLRESQRQPIVVVFEDLHWIDAETQVLLDILVESLPTARVLLLVNYRPEYQHPWGRKTYYTQLRLDTLPPESSGELLRDLLGADGELEPLKRLLTAKTGGNPLFLEESVRALADIKTLTGARGAYRLTEAIERVQIPATVQAILAARIDRLALEEKRLLQAAAVIGQDVPLILLQAVVEVGEQAVSEGLAALQAGEYLYEKSLFPEFEYTFKHALIQEAAYQSMLRATRRQYHQRIARVLEERFPETRDLQPELLAHHYTEAEMHDPAAGYWRRAGDRAFQRSANVDAIRYLTRGVELLKALPDAADRVAQELSLQIALGSALQATRGFGAPEVEAAYARARELSRRADDSPTLFGLLRGLSNFSLVRADFTGALEMADEQLRLASRLGDDGLLSEAHRARGWSLFFLGALAESRASLGRGIELYNFERHRNLALLYGQDPGVLCRAYQALALFLLGYPDQAHAMNRDAIALARQVGHPFTLADVEFLTALLYQLSLDVDRTQEHLDVVMAIAGAHEFQFWLGLATVQRGWVLGRRGQWREGAECMRQGMAGLSAAGAKLMRACHAALLAETLAAGDRTDEALSALADGLAAARESGGFFESELERRRGELLLLGSADARSDAEACFRRALDVAGRQNARLLELRAAVSLSRLLDREGRREDARHILSDVYTWFTEGFDTPDLRVAKSLLDELSASPRRGEF